MQPSAASRGAIWRQRVLLGLGVLFNFLLPWGLYRLSEPRVGETRAIVISAVVPAVWSLVQFVRNRKVDVMSAFVLGGIALSLLLLALGGSPKVLLFRESLLTGIGGLVLIASAMIGRPLMYAILVPVIRAGASPQSAFATVIPSSVLARAVAQLQSYLGRPWFRRVMTVMTIACGLILVAETVVRSVVIFSVPTERALLIGPVVRQSAAGLILLLTFLYFVPAVRRGAAEDERAEELASEAPPA